MIYQMKNFLSPIVITILSFVSIHAQKVDIDNFRFYISNTRLPDNYVPIEKRTFDVKVTGDWNKTDIKNAIFIPGWDLDKNDPTLEIVVNLEPMTRGGMSISTSVEEKKDKNGKVTSSTKYYTASSSNNVYGSCKILGMKNEMPRQMSKKELEKQAKKEKEAKEKKESNPFLSNVSTNQEPDVVVDTKTNKEVAYYENLTQNYGYSTNKSTSQYTASREWETNNYNEYTNHKNAYQQYIVRQVNGKLQEYYGYQPYQHYAKFKELDSEKHPEYTMYSNAIIALKTIFSKMRYNKPVEEIEQDLLPIIKYFDDIVSKYSKDEKHEKRLRAATFFNLGVIFIYLDRHDRAIEIGNKMIALDLETDDAQDIIDASTNLKKQLAFHNMTSRHIVPRNDAEREENQGEAEAKSED
jgi:hypothetical protein